MYEFIKDIASEIISDLLEGGPGSGHWGHKGRPGMRGGSLPSGTGSLSGGTGEKRSFVSIGGSTGGLFLRGKESASIMAFHVAKGRKENSSWTNIIDHLVHNAEVGGFPDRYRTYWFDALGKHIGENGKELKKKFELMMGGKKNYGNVEKMAPAAKWLSKLIRSKRQ